MNAKKWLWFCVAVAAGAVFGAASDLPRLDSSAFDLKYEMEVLPTAEDLDGNGFLDFGNNGKDTTWLSPKDGYVNFDCSSANNYVGCEVSADADGDVWRRYGPTSQTGFTVETRLRVTDEAGGVTAAFCLWASVPDSSVHAFLNFRTNALLWGTGTVLTNMDTKSTFHTYRIARAAGENVYSVWCDGTLVRDGLTTGYNGGSTSFNRLLIGSIGGAYKGKASVAYLRFTKGGYAPARTEKSSVEFAHKYEMEASDERFSPTANATDWTLSGGEQGTASLANGVLSVVQPTGKMRYYGTSAPMDSSIAASSPFTLELKVRPVTAWDSTHPVLNILCGTPRAAGSFFIGTNSVCWNNDRNVIWRGDNTDKAHVYRFAYDGDTDYGFTLWRDDELIGQNLACFRMTSDFNYARFGIASSTSHGGSFELDYIRWTTDGVFAPYVPPKGTLFIVR